jgi:hypothetical protein
MICNLGHNEGEANILGDLAPGGTGALRRAPHHDSHGGFSSKPKAAPRFSVRRA